MIDNKPSKADIEGWVKTTRQWVDQGVPRGAIIEFLISTVGFDEKTAIKIYLRGSDQIGPWPKPDVTIVVTPVRAKFVEPPFPRGKLPDRIEDGIEFWARQWESDPYIEAPAIRKMLKEKGYSRREIRDVWLEVRPRYGHWAGLQTLYREVYDLLLKGMNAAEIDHEIFGRTKSASSYATVVDIVDQMTIDS